MMSQELLEDLKALQRNVCSNALTYQINDIHTYHGQLNGQNTHMHLQWG